LAPELLVVQVGLGVGVDPEVELEFFVLVEEGSALGRVVHSHELAQELLGRVRLGGRDDRQRQVRAPKLLGCGPGEDVLDDL
jgi:hypothetical protein